MERNTPLIKFTRLRNILNAICLFSTLLCAAAFLDGLAVSFRVPDTRIDLVRGESIEITGDFFEDARSVKELAIVSSNPNIHLDMSPEPFMGFWLGNPMWRGTVVTDPGMDLSIDTITITLEDTSAIPAEKRATVAGLSTFEIHVYPDEDSLRAHAVSIIKRFFNLSPWSLMALSLPAMLLTGLMIYRISTIMDARLAELGQADVFRVKALGSDRDIYFGLGKKHGLAPGDPLILFDEEGRRISRVLVSDVGDENSSAHITGLNHVRPGWRVQRLDASDRS